MRLITWNCKGGFERKHEAIARFKPDVLVIPEAGRLDAISHVLGEAPVNSAHWIGENPRKGLGVVSYGGYSMSVHEAYEPRFRWILPLEIRGPASCTLFAIWTVPSPPSRTYAQVLFDAFDHYAPVLCATRVVLAGDFNQNVAFDKPRQALTFTALLSRYAGMDLQSLYHLQSGCEHGVEKDPTFFLHHKLEKKHHLDFVFASAAMRAEGYSISVGSHSEWGRASDHMPLICSFGLDGRDG